MILPEINTIQSSLHETMNNSKEEPFVFLPKLEKRMDRKSENQHIFNGNKYQLREIENIC